MIEEVQPVTTQCTAEEGRLTIGAFLHMVLSYADERGISVGITASIQCLEGAIGNASFVGNVDHIGPGVVNLLEQCKAFAKKAEEEAPKILLPDSKVLTL
jgi:hypothetical protein